MTLLIRLTYNLANHQFSQLPVNTGQFFRRDINATILRRSTTTTPQDFSVSKWMNMSQLYIDQNIVPCDKKIVKINNKSDTNLEIDTMSLDIRFRLCISYL